MSKKIRFAAASPRIRPGDVEGNAQLIIQTAKRAAADGAQLLALPEMCLTGVTVGTALCSPYGQALIRQEIMRINNVTADLGLIMGIGFPNVGDNGLLSMSALLEHGMWVGTVRFANNIYPYGFKPYAQYARERCLMHHEIKNFKLSGGQALLDNSWGYHIAKHTMLQSGYNATAVSYEETQDKLRFVSGFHGAAIAYASPGLGESTSEAVFDGYCAIAANGRILAEAKPLSEDAYCVADIPRPAKPNTDLVPPEPYASYLHEDPERAKRECVRILDLQAVALERRFKHVGGKGYVVGVSGGLDSALALLACCAAVDRMGRPRQSVLGVSMPGFGSSSRTKNNARDLVKALGCTYEEISIVDACRQHFKDIKHDENVHDAVFENAQARERTKILLSLSNKYRLLDVGTGDLSEAALGWTTFGGDNLAQYNIHGSIPKTIVRRVVDVACERFPEAADVLRDILATPVSPELLPTKDGEIAQKTEELIGRYELHDIYLYDLFVRHMTVRQAIIDAHHRVPDASDRELYDTLEVFVTRFYGYQYKRIATPECPVLLASVSAPNYHIPGDAVPYSMMQQVIALRPHLIPEG